MFPPFLNAMGNSSGLFPKVKISILKREATQQITAVLQCSEQSDHLRENAVLIFISCSPSEARGRLRQFSAGVGRLFIESRVNYNTRGRFTSADC